MSSDLDSTILSSANTSETDLTLTSETGLFRPQKVDQAPYNSHYGELDLDSLHLETNEPQKWNLKQDQSKNAVLDELQKISLQLKKESKRQKEFEDSLLKREKMVEQREKELNDFSFQLMEKENRVVTLEASLFEMKQNFEIIIQSKVNEGLKNNREQFLESLSALEKELKEKTSEVKRLQGSFSILKDTCDKQKSKLTEFEQKNALLQTQLTSTNGRLKNLLRQQKSSNNVSKPEAITKQPKAKLISRAINCNLVNITRNESSANAQLNKMDEILSDQFDWLCEFQFESFKDSEIPNRESVLAKSNKLIVLLINNFLNNTQAVQSISPRLRVSMLRTVYWTLYFGGNSASSFYPNSNLHKLSEQLIKSMEVKNSGITSNSNLNQTESDQFCSSQESNERLYSLLILMRTCNETYKLVKTVTHLKKELNSAEFKANFVNIRAPMYISTLVNTHKQAEFAAILDIYVQISLESSLEPNLCLPAILDEILVEKLSKLLQDASPEPQLLEKLMVVMQRICKSRNLKKLFDQKNLTPHVQQLWLKANTDNAFLALSVRSVLSSVGANIPILK